MGILAWHRSNELSKRLEEIPGVGPQVASTIKEYGALKVDQAKRLKELEKENARIKRLLADAELDKAILKETASENW